MPRPGSEELGQREGRREEEKEGTIGREGVARGGTFGHVRLRCVQTVALFPRCHRRVADWSAWGRVPVFVFIRFLHSI